MLHIIKAHEPSVTLFSRDGEVRVFKSHRLREIS